MGKHTRLIVVSLIVAFVLWYIIFVIKPLNFWVSMCLGIVLLIITAVSFDRDIFKAGRLRWRHVIIGVISAAVLYGVFFVGNYLAAFIIPSKDAQIGSVYMNRGSTSPFLIGAALLFVIGPGEELFWRGFIQKHLTEKFGAKVIIISAIIYAAAHIVTMNFMLIMASLICGLFWGALYYKEKSIYPIIISHALWDITVFLILPFQ